MRSGREGSKKSVPKVNAPGNLSSASKAVISGFKTGRPISLSKGKNHGYTYKCLERGSYEEPKVAQSHDEYGKNLGIGDVRPAEGRASITTVRKGKS